MTEEQINQKALEAYPEKLYKDCDGNSYDDNENYREGYIKALEEISSLSKVKGWVARDRGGDLHIFKAKPDRVKDNLGLDYDNYWCGEYITELDCDIFPDLTWESEPIEVELLIRKI